MSWPLLLCLVLGVFLGGDGLGAQSSQSGEWILRLPKKPLDRIFLRHHKIPVLRRFGPLGRYAVIKPRRSLLQNPRLRSYLQPNYTYQTMDADPDVPLVWGFQNVGQTPEAGKPGIQGKDIGAFSAWELSHPEQEVVVALIDTGIDLKHPELENKLWKNSEEIANNGVDDDKNGFIDDEHGWNFVSDSTDVRDDKGHGTFCAGILGAEAENGQGARGIARRVRFMVLKALDSGGFGKTENAVSAITYAVKQGAQIINASWGGEKYDAAMYETLRWAGEQGALVVAAAGNRGFNNDTSKTPTFPASYRLPAILSVAAYDNRDQLWAKSNFGKKTVQIGAPGVRVFSTRPGGYGWGDGTSYAVPFVTGVAALLKAKEPKISLRELKGRLLNTSDVIHYYQKERIQSAGRVHAYQALEDIRPIRPKAPMKWEKRETYFETPHPYPNHFHEKYTVHHAGARYIRVHFEKFETEFNYDWVTLRDSKGREVYAYSGDQSAFWSADALGDTLEIEIKADKVTRGFGFKIDAYEVSFEDFRNPMGWDKGEDWASIPYRLIWPSPLSQLLFHVFKS